MTECDWCGKPAWHKMEQFNKDGSMINYLHLCGEHARQLVKKQAGWTSATSHWGYGRPVVASKPCKICGSNHYPLCKGARKPARPNPNTFKQRLAKEFGSLAQFEGTPLRNSQV